MECQFTSLWETASIVIAIVFRFASFCRIAKLSRDETPDGSLHAFAWDDVALCSIPIYAITAWLSLSPSSSTRIPIGLPYGSLPQWERYGLTTFYVSTMSGLGLAYPPVA